MDICTGEECVFVPEEVATRDDNPLFLSFLRRQESSVPVIARHEAIQSFWVFFSDTSLHTFVTKSIKSLEGKSIPQGYFQRFAKGRSLRIRFAHQYLIFIIARNFLLKILDSAFPPNPHFSIFIFFDEFE